MRLVFELCGFQVYLQALWFPPTNYYSTIVPY